MRISETDGRKGETARQRAEEREKESRESPSQVTSASTDSSESSRTTRGFFRVRTLFEIHAEEDRSGRAHQHQSPNEMEIRVAQPDFPSFPLDLSPSFSLAPPISKPHPALSVASQLLTQCSTRRQRYEESKYD